MLVETLKEIKCQPIFSKKSLAIKLNTSEEMVEITLEQLEKMGYIAEEKPNPLCSGNCKFCSTKCTKSPLKTMLITKKGEDILSS